MALTIDRYAVIGNPIAHSKSPIIQTAFAEATGQALTYERLLAPRDGFVATVERFASEGGKGLNITIPFKLEAFALAREHSVNVIFELADVHNWAYPEAAYDVVCEIFTQFSVPAERELKWAGMRKALKPGGLLIIQGYTPRQLTYGTGGPKQVDQLYTRPMLEQAFGDFQNLVFREEELEMHEGAAHSGMSAVIGLTCKKPR
jgi:SAM-dependent methyltransferase